MPVRKPPVFHVKSVHCCGIKDIKGMNGASNVGPLVSWTPKAMLQGFVKSLASFANYHAHGKIQQVGMAHATFSYAYDKGVKTGYRGKAATSRLRKFKAWVEKTGLGTMVIAENPSPVYSGNHIIQSAIFTPNNEAIIAYAVKNKWIKDVPKPRNPGKENQKLWSKW